MMTIHFTVSGKPRGKQRPRVTRHGCFTPKETKEYEEAVLTEFNTARWNDLNSAVYRTDKVTQAKVRITACFPVPVSWSKVRKRQAYGMPYTGKPDADNIAKIILDGLNGAAYPDDAMVTCVSVTKRYCLEGEQPGVDVTLALALE